MGSTKLQINENLKELGASVLIYPGDDEGHTTLDTLKTIGSVGGGIITVLGVIVEINWISGLGAIFLGISLGPDIWRGANAPAPVCSTENDGNLICGDGG
ncbi:hypothetical protein VFC49_08330 [Thermococcus sp. SY098]|uniref:hypothetical protein n=1 Tax=Thermococcus sp. SY098 TaxID=3111325 RepID=UPI002D782E46|nr:hypothetical protein [Thermococcus sp. SY098]WRS52063.1 hypothetical protein VFC49_08330 [Thermococcus sp. SY098]